MKREIIPLVVLHLLTVGTRSFAWCIPDVIISAWARATCLTQPVSILARVESGAPFCDWYWIFPQGLQGSFIPYPDYSLASVWSASPGEYWVEAWGRSCCGEWDYDTARVTVVEVESISSSRNSACVGGEIAFTVTTNPPGYGWLITWSGGGSPVGGSGSIFRTRWDNHGVKTVTATCGSSSKSKQVTIAAVTNFRLVGREFDPDTHALRFYYRWDSTSGNLEDLCGCSLGETVVYPNGNPYVWPKPPWNDSTRNPTVRYDGAQAGFAWDEHRPGTLAQPYAKASFSAWQTYNWIDCMARTYLLMGPHEIVREVKPDGDCRSGWQYYILKTGYEGSFCLP